MLSFAYIFLPESLGVFIIPSIPELQPQHQQQQLLATMGYLCTCPSIGLPHLSELGYTGRLISGTPELDLLPAICGWKAVKSKHLS